MSSATSFLQYVAAFAFAMFGFIGLRGWMANRTRPNLALAVATLSLGFVSIVGRLVADFGIRSVPLSNLNIVMFLTSGLALIEYRHVYLPLARRVRAGVWGVTIGVGIAAIAARFPTDPDIRPNDGQLVVAYIMIGVWILELIEPAYRFFRVSRKRPPVERGRLRFLAAGYGGIAFAVLVAISVGSQPSPEVQFAIQVIVVSMLPVIFIAVAAPKRIRARWITREFDRQRSQLLLTLPAIVWTVDMDMNVTSTQGGGVGDLAGGGPRYVGPLESFFVDRGIQDDPSADQALSMHRRALAGEQVTYDVTFSGRSFQTRLEPIVGPEGVVEGVVGMAIDISERITAENALRTALEREQQAVEHLRAADEMKNAFLSAVSHELRTPLTAVMGYAQTLQREDLLNPDDREQIIERLIVNSEKLGGLLGDLLDLDRLGRGILAPVRKPTDVGALVRRVAEAWRDDTSRTVDVDADPVICSVDPGKTERIVENLLANAAKYTPATATVWIRVDSMADGVTIVVEDDGPGVPEHLRQGIFEPFRQGPDRPSHSPGVGIGLSLVARFAELHGGRAWVEDRPGGGARFSVVLPSAAPSAEGPFSRSGAPAGDESGALGALARGAS